MIFSIQVSQRGSSVAGAATLTQRCRRPVNRRSVIALQCTALLAHRVPPNPPDSIRNPGCVRDPACATRSLAAGAVAWGARYGAFHEVEVRVREGTKIGGNLCGSHFNLHVPERTVPPIGGE
jgi:hypothetical protein